MKRTIVWPPVVVGGRMAMTGDPAADPEDPGAALRQIIRISVQDATSNNPWNERQDLGIPEQTYRPATAGNAAVLEERVRALFRKLERAHRAKLVSVVVGYDRPRSTRTVAIEYEDLENGTRESLEVARG